MRGDPNDVLSAITGGITVEMKGHQTDEIGYLNDKGWGHSDLYRHPLKFLLIYAQSIPQTC